MAHILTIIPKGVRASKKIQTLSCIKDSTKKIQQNLYCAKEAKQKLDEDLLKHNNNIQRSIEAGKDLDTLG